MVEPANWSHLIMIGTCEWYICPSSFRSCLLIYLATCLGGVWSLEQPAGALTEYYPAFRETIQNIFECGGPTAARAPFWQTKALQDSAIALTISHGWFFTLVSFEGVPSAVIRSTASGGGWGITKLLHRKGTMPIAIALQSSVSTRVFFRDGNRRAKPKTNQLNITWTPKGVRGTRVPLPYDPLRIFDFQLWLRFCCEKYTNKIYNRMLWYYIWVDELFSSILHLNWFWISSAMIPMLSDPDYFWLL